MKGSSTLPGDHADEKPQSTERISEKKRYRNHQSRATHHHAKKLSSTEQWQPDTQRKKI